MSEKEGRIYIPPFIKDRFGDKYSIDIVECSEDWLELWLFSVDKRLIGMVKAGVDSGSMQLHDINIFDNVPSHEVKIVRYFKRLLHLKLQRTNFRGLGLGSQLLDMVITHTKYLGLTHIYGGVVARDLKNTPYLYDLYRNHGFAVTELGNSHPTFKARIDLSLG